MTKLNENSASIFLKKLEVMNYLKSQKEGNLKKYGLNHNQRTYSVLTLFDIEKFQTLPGIRKEAIQRYFQKRNVSKNTAKLLARTYRKQKPLFI